MTVWRNDSSCHGNAGSRYDIGNLKSYEKKKWEYKENYEMTTSLYKQDTVRYQGGRMPKFQKYLRLCQDAKFPLLKYIYAVSYRYYAKRSHVEISRKAQIGGGLYIGHAYGITINPRATLGMNCNIHKNCTIGQENRGNREGTPVIGNRVWIGIGATIVGNICIGDDVLIAPNSYVNCDIPSHSVVFGNPCIIKSKKNATAEYINNVLEEKC